MKREGENVLTLDRTKSLCVLKAHDSCRWPEHRREREKHAAGGAKDAVSLGRGKNLQVVLGILNSAVSVRKCSCWVVSPFRSADSPIQRLHSQRKRVMPSRVRCFLS